MTPPSPLTSVSTESASSSSPIAQARDRLSSDFRQMLNDLDTLMSASASQADGEVQALRSRLRERLDTAKAQLGVAQEEIRNRTSRAVEVTNTYVHENPWQVAGGAAAIGLALGVLMSRR
jgi:ElaB/YqjD/DUF883 family membrane-anchored ribosome-binding protein